VTRGTASPSTMGRIACVFCDPRPAGRDRRVCCMLCSKPLLAIAGRMAGAESTESSLLGLMLLFTRKS
jgi:hypothetical protein